MTSEQTISIEETSNDPSALAEWSENELRTEYNRVMSLPTDRDGTPPAKLERVQALSEAIRRRMLAH